MKIIIQIIIGILLLISLVSAIELQAGETYKIDLGIPYSYYEIVRNSTEVNLNISLNGTIASITPSKYTDSGDFDIVFYTEEKEKTVTIYSGGGGGTRTIYKDRNITEYVNQTIEKINKTEPYKPIEIIKIEKKYVGDLIILGISAFLFIGAFVIYFLYKKKQRKHKVL